MKTFPRLKFNLGRYSLSTLYIGNAKGGVKIVVKYYSFFLISYLPTLFSCNKSLLGVRSQDKEKKIQMCNVRHKTIRAYFFV